MLKIVVMFVRLSPLVWLLCWNFSLLNALNPIFQKANFVEKTNEQERNNREERRVAGEKLKKVEDQKEELERRLREAEDDNNRKVSTYSKCLFWSDGHDIL